MIWVPLSASWLPEEEDGPEELEAEGDDDPEPAELPEVLSLEDAEGEEDTEAAALVYDVVGWPLKVPETHIHSRMPRHAATATTII